MKSMYPKKGRVILHIDANAFFASVEIANNPSLRDKPVAVAGTKRRGIILTCNYEARKYGIYTTMPLWEARKKCPELAVCTPNFSLYREASLNLFTYLSTISLLLEPASIDEGYLDITNCHELGTPVEIAERIRRDILKKYNLPVSIGIAPNKFLAKTASDFKKPLGITILRKRDVQKELWPKTVHEMHGIGKKTAEKLHSIGIQTIGDLAREEERKLSALLGVLGPQLKKRANGIDERPVDPDAATTVKSIGNSTTLAFNSDDDELLLNTLNSLSQTVSKRMKLRNAVTDDIQITIRYANFQTVTRSQQLMNPIEEKEDIFQVASSLFNKHWSGSPVRLLGVTALRVEEKEQSLKQLSLFTYENEIQDEEILDVVEDINKEFDKPLLHRGVRHIQKSSSFEENFKKKYGAWKKR
ncbi:DNA polymerase IV [Priestia endophytica]|uniref:DNA polymerase IV n=1 Tax=Priestia endophytica TaxID=135735 RepID=UPI002E1E6173|nr:DNA polymerase IV [Priestia endophytica]MED4073511.1 DNA polymerase IV [Priestia endophytica]